MKEKKIHYCTECKRDMKFIPSVTTIGEFGLYLCEKHFIQWFEKWVEHTIEEFEMFDRQTPVIVALSGGKDSMVLWYVLNKLGYRAEGFHLNLGISGISEKSEQAVRELGQMIGKDPIIVNVKNEIGAGIAEISKIFRTPPCSICGRIKRYYFNRTARLQGFKVIATGHNLDDEAGSLLFNLVNWNEKYLIRKYPVLREDPMSGLPRKVKPLALMAEDRILLYARLNNIPFTGQPCPLGQDAKLHIYKDMLTHLEKQNRSIKRNFYLRFIRKYQKLFQQLPTKEKHKKLQKCKICGEPTPSDVCLVCKIKQAVKDNNPSLE